METVVDKLEALMQKADTDLSYVAVKLEREFSQSQEASDEVNPMKLLERVRNARLESKNLQNDLIKILNDQQNMASSLQQEVLSSLGKLKQIKQQCDKNTETFQEFEDEMKSFQWVQAMAINPQGDSAAITNTDGNNNSNENNNSVDMPDSTEPSPSEQRCGGKVFVPVTQEELDSVSDLVKGKNKLDDINKVYETIFNCFKKKGSASKALTPKDMTGMGLKITGSTGEAKLKVLRTLKIIQISKQGSVKMKT